MLYYGQCSDIEVKFEHYLLRKAIQNYEEYFIRNKLEISSTILRCSNNSVILCAFKFIVNRNLHVNITFSFVYLGSNVGYCKYGGLSVYDYVNNIRKEVFLSCDNWFSLPLNLQSNRTIVSNTETVFLVFYSYIPHNEIIVKIQIESSSCQGINIER